MVDLIVGKKKTKITIHQDILFEASPVLKAAFTSKFREGSERSMHLPEDDPDHVDVLVQFLYSTEVKFYDLSPNPKFDDVVMLAVHLWVLADKYEVVKVKNAICGYLSNLIRSRSNPKAPPAAVTFIYENTTDTATIRQLLVAWHLWQNDQAWLGDKDKRAWLLSLPEFAVDVLSALSQASNIRYGTNPFEDGQGGKVFWEKDPGSDESQPHQKT